MGIYLIIQGIELSEINSVINSKNVDTYKKILNYLKTHSISTGLIESFITPDEKKLTLREALRDIIFGKFKKLKPNLAYNFAMYSICSMYSKKLPNDFILKVDVETNLFNKYLESDFNVNDFDITSIIGANPGIFDMPDIFSEFDGEPMECPVIGILTIENKP